MTRTVCQIGFLVLCLAALSGCKKSTQDPPSPNYYGVQVDLPKLDLQFTNASPETLTSVTLVKRYFRYSQFMQAMMELDKIANDSSLTQVQKKTIADLLEQTKQVIAKAPAQPGQ
jgi:hypothetical protein